MKNNRAESDKKVPSEERRNATLVVGRVQYSTVLHNSCCS
jgi:hypothetical protein